jgi:hypothetical protein
MAKKMMTDAQVLRKVGLILSNEAEFWRGMDYPTAKKLRREYRMLSRRIFDMAAKKRAAVRS